MKAFENAIEKTIMGARWLLVIFYLGLGAALVVYAASFIYKFVKVASGVFAYEEGEMILAMLGLIDAALVASLLVMVMISSYENYVSRLDNAGTELSWLGKLDSGSLKIKVASSIVAISSISLLKSFMNIDKISDRDLIWMVGIHALFVVSGLILAMTDKIAARK